MAESTNKTPAKGKTVEKIGVESPRVGIPGGSSCSSGGPKTECRCGSKNCRKVLF